jgi:hypothetical protein
VSIYQDLRWISAFHQAYASEPNELFGMKQMPWNDIMIFYNDTFVH